jgi:hypothetical protein
VFGGGERGAALTCFDLQVSKEGAHACLCCLVWLSAQVSCVWQHAQATQCARVGLGCSVLCLCGASRTEVTRCGWANKRSIGMPLLLLFDCRGSVVTGCLWSTVQAVLQCVRVELGAVVVCSGRVVVIVVCVLPAVALVYDRFIC